MKFQSRYYTLFLTLFTLFISYSQGFSQTGAVTSFNKISVTSGNLGNALGSNYYFGVSVENMGDFDGDGVKDIAVGSIGYGGKGAVLLMLLNANGTVKSHNVITQGQSGFGATLTSGERFGFDIANIGDLDNDGVTDIVVSQESNSDANFNEGAIYVIFLNANGTVKAYNKITSLTETSLAPVLDGNDRFGHGVAAIGDLDNDGNEDVVVGALLDDDGGSGRGAAYVLFLNSNGTMKGFQKISDTQGGFLGTLDNGDNFGTAVESIGDFDSDGNNDIAVSAYLDDDGGSFAGAIWLLYLNSNGTVKGFDKISKTSGGMTAGPFSNSYFGYSIANLGDIDGDGITDIAAGAINELSGRGAVYSILLNSNGTVKGGGLRITSGFNIPTTFDFNDWFGSGIVGMGDINGDGKRDMIVGTQNDDDGSSNAGALYLCHLQGTVSCVANAGFTTSADTICVGDSVGFTNTSSGATAYTWRENGTVFSTATSPTRTFASVGSYTIRLTADDGPGCIDSTTMMIEVVSPPTASIIPAGPTNICIGDSVNLVASGGGTYQWMFNGGMIPGATGNSYYANAAGTYSVAVSMGSNCSDTDSVVVNVGLQDIIWTDMVNTMQSNDTLFETSGSNGWGNKGAASIQVLQPMEDGAISHVVHDYKGTYYFGFSYFNVGPDQKSIDHAFYVKKNQLRVREAIGTDLVVGTSAPGDSLTIVRVGGMLTWLKNGIPVYSTPVNPNLPMLADVALFKKNSFLTHMQVTFCSTTLPLSAISSWIHNSCQSSPSGSITLMPNGGVLPYSYAWSNGDTTVMSSGLGAGLYSGTVYDSMGDSVVMSFELFSRIAWTDLIGASSNGDTLTRTAGGKTWGGSGGRSVQVLQPNADGMFSHVVSNVSKFYYLGVSSNNPDAAQTSIGWSFYNAKGTLRIREMNSAYFAVHGTVLVGDTLKIQRIGSVLNYFKNSTLLRSVPIQASIPLFMDASIYNSGVSLVDNFATFCTDSLAPDSFYAALLNLSHADCFQNNGSASVAGNGGLPPYTYLWNSAETTASISNKMPGNYYCVVTDQNSVDDTVFIEIMNKVIWEGFVGSTANGDTLLRTAPLNGWGQSGARSDNKALNGNNGKLLHIVNSINKNYYIGLSDSDPDASQFTIDYAFYNNKGNLYIREEKTGFFQNYGTVALGDSLVVERRISSMYWYQNGTLLRSIGISPTETLRVDVSMFTANTTLWDVYVDFCDTVPGQKWIEGNGQSSIDNSNILRVYPNPAQDQVKVEISQSGAGSIESMLGQILWQGELKEGLNVLSLKGISAGMYLFRLRTQAATHTRKLLIE